MPKNLYCLKLFFMLKRYIVLLWEGGQGGDRGRTVQSSIMAKNEKCKMVTNLKIILLFE